MYKNDVEIVNIQINQLLQITGQIQLTGSNMETAADKEDADKEALKAYVASADILMASLDSQKVLLQQALDSLAGKLK